MFVCCFCFFCQARIFVDKYPIASSIDARKPFYMTILPIFLHATFALAAFVMYAHPSPSRILTSCNSSQSSMLSPLMLYLGPCASCSLPYPSHLPPLLKDGRSPPRRQPFLTHKARFHSVNSDTRLSYTCIRFSTTYASLAFFDQLFKSPFAFVFPHLFASAPPDSLPPP